MPLNYLDLYARRKAKAHELLRELQTVENPAWQPLSRPLNEMRVALITSGAIREGGQKPFPYLGDASYRMISSDPAFTDLRVDHRNQFGTSARKDPEIVFPRRALKALADQGIIGSVAPFHLSISGGHRLHREIKEELSPALARHLTQAQVDLALFLPY